VRIGRYKEKKMSKPVYQNVAFWILVSLLVFFLVFLVFFSFLRAAVLNYLEAVRGIQKQKEAQGDIEGCLYPLSESRGF